MKSMQGMRPLVSVLADLALEETRTIIITRPHKNLPPGSYGLIEFYCADRKCDCRRVLFQVLTEQDPEKVLATINFGWESVAFYTRWLHGDRETAKDMAGASLDPLNPQSPYAETLLDLIRVTALQDPAYVERLARHYRLFKKALTKTAPR